MSKLSTALGPLLAAGLLLSTFLAIPARALELATGGTFYVCVMEGDCPQPIDLWGVGPGRNPLFLGHYQGHVSKRPPIYMGSYKAGQELYIWNESNDPGTGERRSQEIKSPDAYKVGIDPRGGYAIELKSGPGHDEPALKIWVYPGRPPVNLSQTGINEKSPAVVGPMGSVVVNEKQLAATRPGGVAAVAPSPSAPADSKQADTWGGWHWPALQLAVASLLFVSYRRSRQVALTVGDAAALSIGNVDVQSFGRTEEASTFSFQSARPAPLVPPVIHAPPPSVTRPPVRDIAPPAAPVAPAPEELEETAVDWRNQLAAPAGEEIPSPTPHDEAPAISGSKDPSSGTPSASTSASTSTSTPTLTPTPTSTSSSTSSSPVPPAPRPSSPPSSTSSSSPHSEPATHAHFHARAPEGWSPLPPEPSAPAARNTRAPARLPDRGATPIHQVAHASAAPAADALLIALGRRRPLGLPLAFTFTPTSTSPSTSSTSSAPLPAIARALSSAFHDLEVVHSDEERIVLSGLDLALRRRVSVHALASGLARDGQLAAQFVREAQQFATLSHRGLLRIHRVSAEPVPHFVAEPLPGHLLCTLLSGSPLALHEVLSTGSHVTEALDFLHQRGRVYGDLRPSRVVGGSHGELKLCPPMFPHASVDALAAQGVTLAERRTYRAPEVAGGAIADYRADIHALGLMLHHMLTGAPATPADDDTADPQFRYRPSVPEALVTVIRRCLQSDPARRYQDCGIARQMLETMAREHGGRERVVLACLPALARVVRLTLQPLGKLLATARDMTADELGRAVVTPAWREPIRLRLLGSEGGLSAIGVLLERGQGLKRWAQEAKLLEMLGELGQMAIQLAGLATLIDSGGPRHPSVAERARSELVRLSETIAQFDLAVQAEVSSRLLDFGAIAKDAVASAPQDLEIDASGIAPALRGLFAEPGPVRGSLVSALGAVLAAGKSAGAKSFRLRGAYEEGFKRIVITIVDDGRLVPAPVVRPPLAIVPRLTRPASTETAMTREMETAFDTIERLGGRVMVTNRNGTAGVEVRMEIPSNLC